MSKTTNNYRVSYCFLVVCMLFVFAGCSEKRSNSQDELPVLSSAISSYPDIELPADMKWDGRGSMAINTESFSGGILKYSGRVEINSLKDFIISSMKKHQWRHAGEASYSNMLLAFTKPNKTCMAVLSEGIGGSYGLSYVTLYVTVDKISAKGTGLYDEPARSKGTSSYGQPIKSKDIKSYDDQEK
jgi:hypothetical protein